MKRPLVVVPTYDEVDSLPFTLSRLRASAPALDVLVVDDASPDGTGTLAARLAEADAHLSVLHRRGERGLGPAYLAGFGWGLARGHDAFVEMDADLSHDPADVPRLIDALTSADVAIGSRYVPGGRVVDWPARRLALSRGGNTYVRVATGLPLRDATSGFRSYRAGALEALDLDEIRSDGYGFQVELALRAWQAGFRVVELPITFTERRAGASKMSKKIVAEAVWRVALWGLRGPRHPPPVPAGASVVALSARAGGHVRGRPGPGWDRRPR